MKPIVINTYILLMFLAYVMRRAGTFSMEEKVRMIEFLSHMAANPESRKVAREGEEILLGGGMRSLPWRADRLRVQSQASKNPEHTPRL